MTRLPFLVLLTFPAMAFAVADPPAEKKAQDNARAVSRHLRAHLKPAPGPEWKDFVLRTPDAIGKEEFATTAGWEDWADGTNTPYVTITRGYLVALGDNQDALALLVGRELARLSLGLAPPKGTARSEATEADADLYAVKLLLKSGYSVRRAVAGLARLPANARPAWVERVEKLLDKP